MTMATIINSDIIPFRHRGMYQAAQNGLHGFGSICGASLGGLLADSVGWRWCFLLQVPISVFALVVGYFVIQLPGHADHADSRGFRGVWQQVDLSGALLLVLGLSVQLVGLSLGGNELPWDNVWVITSLVASVVLLALFVVVEAYTSAVPVIPLRMLRGVLPVCTQIANVCVGMAAYAVRLSSKLIAFPAADFHSICSCSPCSSRWSCWILPVRLAPDWLFHPWQRRSAASLPASSCRAGENWPIWCGLARF